MRHHDDANPPEEILSIVSVSVLRREFGEPASEPLFFLARELLVQD
jgi:hypothetical protein